MVSDPDHVIRVWFCTPFFGYILYRFTFKIWFPHVLRVTIETQHHKNMKLYMIENQLNRNLNEQNQCNDAYHRRSSHHNYWVQRTRKILLSETWEPKVEYSNKHFPRTRPRYKRLKAVWLFSNDFCPIINLFIY